MFASLMGTVSLLAVVLTAADLGGGLPLRYFEHLNFPVLTVLFPVVGMLVIGMLALVSWLKESKATAPAAAQDVTPATVVDQPKPTAAYPKAA